MKNKAVFLTAGGLLFAGAGIWVYNKISAVKSLDYKFGLIDSLKFGILDTTFNQSAVFTNNSNTDITINAGDISAFVGGVAVGRVVLNDKITIRANAQTTVKLPIVLTNISLIKSVPNFKTGNFDINYKGWLRAEKINFPINYTYNFRT